MAWRLFGAKPLPGPMLDYCQSGPWERFNKILFEIDKFSFKRIDLKMSSAKLWPFCLGLNELNDTLTDTYGNDIETMLPVPVQFRFVVSP